MFGLNVEESKKQWQAFWPSIIISGIFVPISLFICYFSSVENDIHAGYNMFGYTTNLISIVSQAGSFAFLNYVWHKFIK